MSTQPSLQPSMLLLLQALLLLLVQLLLLLVAVKLVLMRPLAQPMQVSCVLLLLECHTANTTLTRMLDLA
jgi:hypothetical protein